ncbi:MAG: GatB/YqeY domain-containing protein [Bacteroidetes bacterium]|nr:MAG: GatB/YqeY domain-containing protein [Bacteroidota bacterium]
MTLAEQINEDIKAAMLAKDAKKLEALRAIKSGLLILKTGKGASGEIPQDLEMGLLKKLVKQRKESAAIYRDKDRAELAEVEEFQAGIIEKYLPEQISGDELKAIVQGIITETGAESMKDMGRVMGMVSKKLAGKADNKEVSMLVKELLA